jgi:hypothetical protein
MASAGPWCLVLAIWGEKYNEHHVNELARQARANSFGLAEIVLFTDRLRDGIDADVRQTLFPAYFHRPDFFAGAYRAKLAVFSRDLLPRGRPCVFVDLDTVVTGDLGRIAALIDETERCLMMPPAGLGFGALRRTVDWPRKGKFPVGNSSLVAFHSDARHNIAEAFQRLHASSVDVDQIHMRVDDVFISWFHRGRIGAIPNQLAVSFRREFMARARFILWLRKLMPGRTRRRAGLVAVTLNGMASKPEQLVSLRNGSVMRGESGRIGYWSDSYIGPIRQKIISSARRLLADQAAGQDGTSSTT